MTPTPEYDLLIPRGATFERGFNLTKNGATPNAPRVPLPLTGAIPRFTLRTANGLTRTWSVEGGQLLFEPLNGRVGLLLSPGAIENLDFTTATYRFTVEFPNGKTKLYSKGKVIVIA
ncbi:MAG: hypothetical protein MSG64_07480 [Pyrinomonadaceae bacterium MAG19_C2-C3]|nr:hypothetical protein [Pyrinomonadaceae bacterium MAG19_C2-C3]